MEVSVHFLHAGTILKYSFLNQSISATKERQITEACLDKKSVVQFTPITLIYVTVIYVIRFEKMVGLTSYVAEIWKLAEIHKLRSGNSKISANS